MSHSLTKLQKAEVKHLVRQPAETKYVAAYASVYGGGVAAVPATAFGVLNSIVSGGVGWTPWLLIPPLAEGVAGNQRVGNRITNVYLKSTWQFYINPAISNYPTVDATVKVFIVRAKTAKSFAAVQSIPIGSLLDNGDGTSIDWTSTGANNDKMLDMYPVNKEQFTVLKIHSFRLTKNGDSPTGGTAAGAAPNMTSHQTKNFTHTMSHPGTVIYPDNNLAGNTLPNNISYFAYVVAYDTNSFAVLAANTIIANCRAHMYFKDM